jgi:hypothetical protein
LSERSKPRADGGKVQVCRRGIDWRESRNGGFGRILSAVHEGRNDAGTRYRSASSPLLAATSVVLPPESDGLPIEGEQAVIGDRDPMRVSAEIPENVHRAMKGGFGVDNPILSMEPAQKAMKLLGVGQQRRRPGTVKTAAPVEAFQTGAELTAEDAAEDLYRKKERITRPNPAAMVWRESAGGNHAVNVRMEQKILSPGVQDTDDSDLGAQVPGIGCDFQYGLRTGGK